MAKTYDDLANMNPEDLFEDNSRKKEENESKVETAPHPEESKSPSESLAPANYLRIELDSVGKLDAPPELHFRNYTMEEVWELAEMTRENEQEVIVRVLNNLCFESFDCAFLHPKEVEYILLNITAKWWGSTINSMGYFRNPNLRNLEDLQDPSNISRIDLPIENIKTDIIPEGFQEPVEIDLGEEGIYHFRLPRMADYIRAARYTRNKYRAQDRRFSDFRMRLRKEEKNPGTQDIDLDLEREYEEHQKNKRRDEILSRQAQQITAVGGHETPEDIDQKLEVLKTQVPATAWIAFRRVEKANMFGVNPNVTFFDEQSGEPISRRFQFRFLDFIPSLVT